jgi:hypothetical protein
MAFSFDSNFMETATADVEVESQTSASTEAAESSTAAGTSGEQQPSVTGTEAVSAAQSAQPAQTTQEVDPLEGVPTVEELQQLVQQKVPHSEALARLRPAYEGLKGQYGELQTSFEPWKPVVETIGDPQLAQSAYELISSIHTPSPENPSGFTSRPFLEKIEQESPGTIDQIFAEICSFPLDIDGQRTTVVRELYKAHGLNPDRIDDYRNIDSLRASGVVTDADLNRIPEQYRDAFKSMSQAAREDLLGLLDASPVLAEEHLRNAKHALDAQQFRERDEQTKAEQAKAAQQQFEQQVSQAVTQDIQTEVESISNSIHQSLSSQWKPSTDEAQNSLEYAKILSTIATLQNPGYRFVAEKALKAADANIDGIDDLINQWVERRSAYTTYTQMGDQWQAKRALSESSLAKQKLLIKLNDYALKLAQFSGNRLQSASQQTVNQLETASSRFVPNGNGNQQQGMTNPYAQNPHTIGSPEYYAFNRKVDREFQLTNASAYGG